MEVGHTLFEVLQRQLGRCLPPPVHVDITHNAQCIPTMTPGHMERMNELKQTLLQDPWNGRLEVIGAGVGGVSVADCVSQGRGAGKGWRDDADNDI